MTFKCKTITCSRLENIFGYFCCYAGRGYFRFPQGLAADLYLRSCSGFWII